MLATLIILLIAATLFVSGKVRSDLVAICALLALLLSQILTPTEALAGFSNTTVIMMVGLFIVGGGIFQTGLAKMIGGQVIKLAGTSETRLFLLVMLVTALNPYIGYENAAKTAKKAYKENISLKEACVALGFLTAEKFDEVFRPEEMAYPQK